MELRQIIVEAEKFRVLDGEYGPFDGLRPLQHGVLLVGVAAGVLIGFVRQHLLPHDGKILFINLPDRGRVLLL